MAERGGREEERGMKEQNEIRQETSEFVFRLSSSKHTGNRLSQLTPVERCKHKLGWIFFSNFRYEKVNVNSEL